MLPEKRVDKPPQGLQRDCTKRVDWGQSSLTKGAQLTF